MPDVADTFQAAVHYHNAGDLRQAEIAYRQVLAADPRHARALHHLGMIALRVRQYAAAADFARQAIGVEPAEADFYPTLAEACRGLGQVAEAVAAYRQAIALRPEFAEAHSNLGTLLHAQGDLAGAAECYRGALAVQPSNAHAHHNLAIVLQVQGDLDGAAEHFAAAVRANPAAVESQLALGYILKAQGKVDEALRFFREAVGQRPDLATAHCGLGYVYQSQGQLDDALACYRRACELAPNYAMAHFNLATVLRNLGRREEALAEFVESLRHDATSVDANLGVSGVQLELGWPDEAVAAARRAVELAPGSRDAMAQLAAALHAQGDLDGVIAANRRVVELDPKSFGSHSNLVYAMTAHEDYDAATVLAEHRAWAEQYAEPLTRQYARPHDNDPQVDRRLRVGYVSAHFRQHAVSFFSEPMIAAHDATRFEVYAYSDVRSPDEVSRRFQASVAHWRDISGLGDEAVAELVRRDRIDILVDLAGHIGGNRLLVFARRPAPVQVTYLGYQNTTGMSAMDYRLTDEHADPPGLTDPYYTERLVRLPRAFFCYAEPSPSPELNELPALTAGQFTFASLNQTIKIRPRTWATWARILAAVPGARLLTLAYGPGQFEQQARGFLERAGVDPGRLEVVAKRPRYEYLQLHHEIDLALDSFPFNGHTTVCDALWMGVPSIMLEGDRYASRFGGSVLVNVGLDELIARTEDQYVELAVRLAGELDRLAELRRTMRDRLRASPLLDAAGFTGHLEEAYRAMWRRWCRGA